MSWFRYTGDAEHLHLGPPVRVLSPGEMVASAVALDPGLFEAVPGTDERGHEDTAQVPSPPPAGREAPS